MPWCEACSRFLNPNTVATDGTCPSCGRAVGDPEQHPAGGPGGEEADPFSGTEDVKAPWHFKLMVAMTVIYLGWRIVQMVTEVAS